MDAEVEGPALVEAVRPGFDPAQFRQPQAVQMTDQVGRGPAPPLTTTTSAPWARNSGALWLKVSAISGRLHQAMITDRGGTPSCYGGPGPQRTRKRMIPGGGRPDSGRRRWSSQYTGSLPIGARGVVPAGLATTTSS